MEKRLMFLAIAFLSAIVLAIAAYSSIPDPGHGADNVYIFINGSSMNLQDAITNSLFRNCSVTGGQYSSQIVHGHSGNEILVNVNGSVKTLQQAINDKALIKSDAGKSPASYSTNLGLVQYQTANKIRITNKSGIEKNLQASINAGELKCVPPEPEPITWAECYIAHSSSSGYLPGVYSYNCVREFIITRGYQGYMDAVCYGGKTCANNNSVCERGPGDVEFTHPGGNLSKCHITCDRWVGETPECWFRFKCV